MKRMLLPTLAIPALILLSLMPTAAAEPIITENVCPPPPSRPVWYEIFTSDCIVCDGSSSCLFSFDGMPILDDFDCRVGVSHGSCLEYLMGGNKCDWSVHYVHCWNDGGDWIDTRSFCDSLLRACDLP